MTEFKEEHKVSLLMGSPPGYVGYGEGGVLTEAVRRRPYSVILLDEMEKAHPGVQDIFFQVFDKGNMKDGEGRDIDFKNTVIIMTSNAGTDLITRLFADPETAPDAAGLAEALMPELMKFFKPAFLGRVTLVPYFPLSPEIIRQIVGLQLSRMRRRVQNLMGRNSPGTIWSKPSRRVALRRRRERETWKRSSRGRCCRSCQRRCCLALPRAQRSTASPWAWTRLDRSNTHRLNPVNASGTTKERQHGHLHEVW